MAFNKTRTPRFKNLENRSELTKKGPIINNHAKTTTGTTTTGTTGAGTATMTAGTTTTGAVKTTGATGAVKTTGATGVVKTTGTSKVTTKTSSQIAATLDTLKQARVTKEKSSTTKGKGTTTRVTIKYDVGYENTLSIRGCGAGLSWESGKTLENVSSNEWVWETSDSFTTCEFKMLINDQHFEEGENHTITSGASVQYSPQFS